MIRRIFEAVSLIASFIAFFVALVLFLLFAYYDFAFAFPDAMLFAIGGMILYAASLLLHFFKNHSFEIRKCCYVFVIAAVIFTALVAFSTYIAVDRRSYYSSISTAFTEEPFWVVFLLLYYEILLLPIMIHDIAWNIRHPVDDPWLVK